MTLMHCDCGRLAGRFDPPSSVGWAALGSEAINSSHSQQVADEAALQGMVLLKNEGMLCTFRPVRVEVQSVHACAGIVVFVCGFEGSLMRYIPMLSS